MVQIKQSNFKCQDTPNDRTEKKKKKPEEDTWC